MDANHDTAVLSTSPVRRFSISLGIAGYLAVLIYGVLLHTFDLPGKVSVPGYLVVWDMYCGWCGYERRVHFVAEGESGTYYDASQIPGAVITPHGQTPRHNFDFQNTFSGKLAQSVLARTEHEPIQRIFVVEQHWPKRFNLPESLRGSTGPSERQVYWHTQAIYNANGEALRVHPDWLALQNDRAIYDNPKLKMAAQRRMTTLVSSAQ